MREKKVRMRLCAILAAMTGCGAADHCKDYHYESQFSYQVRPAFSTPEGIKVDPTGQDISPQMVDALTDAVEECLRQEFGDPPKIPADVVMASECLYDTFDLPIDRSCLTVKVPDDWLVSCRDPNQQVLPVLAPDAFCQAKGITPTPECPCRWRAGIQDRHVIVTTPNFLVYDDPVVRLATSCNNPWAPPPSENSPSLSRCAGLSAQPR